MIWNITDIEEVLQSFNSDIKKGLTTADAAAEIALHGSTALKRL